jgi:ABC-2 type transport system permease protein
VTAALRLVWIGWLLHFKQLGRSAFNAVLQVLWPIFFATVAFFLFAPEALLYASLGAAVMGIWGATSTSAASAMQRERWHGTLELLVAAPAPFWLVLLPICLAIATIGLYSFAATLAWGWLAFGIELRVEHALPFALSIPVVIAALGACGFLMAVAFVRYRTAWALGNLLEYPVWLICGALVPLSLFPGWVRPLSWVLAPTWAMFAIRESATGGNPWPDLAMCVLLGLAYLGAGVLMAERALTAARAKAALALA